MKKIKLLFFICIFSMTLWACGVQRVSDVKEIDDLEYTGSMKLDYATEFSVDYYKDGYKMINIKNEGNYLIVPEGKKVPECGNDVTVLQQPLDNIYLVSSSTMDFFRQLDILNTISLSALKEKDWYIEEAREEMAKGNIVYAGKYSAPDYELILARGCVLAIENTMIYHNPETKEKLEEQGIKVLVDHSSLEGHPLGRMEWIKLYGVLFGKEAEADKFFIEQTQVVDKIIEENTEDNTDKNKKSVAYFYITSNGTVNVRKSGDYISKMIDIAGGKYAFSDLSNENELSTMNIQVEEFLENAMDCDYLIYNSTIEGELESIKDLLSKCPELKDSKAVKNDNVYCTGKNMFQETTGIATMIQELNQIMYGDNSETEYTYLYKLN